MSIIEKNIYIVYVVNKNIKCDDERKILYTFEDKDYAYYLSDKINEKYGKKTTDVFRKPYIKNENIKDGYDFLNTELKCNLNNMILEPILIKILIYIFTVFITTAFWIGLEYFVDGKIVPLNSDSIIVFILSYLITDKVYKHIKGM